VTVQTLIDDPAGVVEWCDTCGALAIVPRVAVERRIAALSHAVACGDPQMPARLVSGLSPDAGGRRGWTQTVYPSEGVEQGRQ